MSLIQEGIKRGYIELINDSNQIRYKNYHRPRNFNNPEEQVQVETFLKLTIDYNYPIENIVLYDEVIMGSSRREADIIVYKDNKHSKPLIVVECKKQEVSDLEFKQAVNQAASYAYAKSGTVKYIWITSGLKDEYYLIDTESDVKQTVSNIPIFGVDKIERFQFAKGGRKEGEYVGNDDVKKRFSELKTIDEDDLTKRFKQAHNALWAGGELNPSEAFDELDKLIFCKIWDERTTRKKGEPYDFQIFNEPIPKDASDEEKKRIEQKISEELYKRILAIYEIGKKKDKEVFKDNIRLNPQKVKTVVGYLQAINLSETDLDSKGKAFETFMGSYFRGDFGQYFTPRSIVKFIVNSLPINNESRVLDTSCGSGGFLLYALDKVREQANKMADDGYFDKDTPRGYSEWHNHWHDFAEHNLYGIEINEQIARTAKMNMIIHDDGHTNVIASDGLLKADVMQEKSGRKGFKYNSFDYIITNPPFGSSVKQNEKAYLHQYSLGNKDVSWLDLKNSAVKGRNNQSTEVLFIEQCRNFLKEEGFLAVVIPDGILTNSSLQYVRDNIEEWFRIIAVVSMPQTAFSHTGAGVKSSVLVLRKWKKDDSEKIKSLKSSIQFKVLSEYNYRNAVAKLETKKRSIIKNHQGFETNLIDALVVDKKVIEKTPEFKDWKKEITDIYNQKINDLKDTLQDTYLSDKQSKIKALDMDYPIFMAIAEDIGYDAVGKPTGNNELEIIEQELQRFIKQVNDGLI